MQATKRHQKTQQATPTDQPPPQATPAENPKRPRKPRPILPYAEYGRMGGRPSKKTQELCDAICEDIAQGLTTIEACDKHGISQGTVWQWDADDEAFHEAYNRARAKQAHSLAEQCVIIADTEADPRRAQYRIQARQWLASKRNAAVYGDKTQIAVSHTLDLSTALQEARARLSAPMTIENGPNPGNVPLIQQPMDDDSEA